MNELPVSLQKLIEELHRIPSVGKKSAVRMAFSIIDYSDANAEMLINAISDAKKHITQCPVCCGLSEDGLTCDICASEKRDRSTVCVVQDYRDAEAIENVHEYNGLYHVLHGALSPLKGITTADLRIDELMTRLNGGEIKEVILATNPDVEGEATAVYLTKLISEMGIKVSRLAYGLPVGSDLEYADAGTLSRAISGRQEIKQ